MNKSGIVHVYRYVDRNKSAVSPDDRILDCFSDSADL